MFDHLLMQKAILLVVLGIGAQWVAWRLKMPAIVLLSLAGIVAGPIFGWLDPAEDLGSFANVLIKLAVAVILFEGGLNLRISELKQAGTGVRRLVLIGLPLSWILGTAASYYIVGLSFPVSSILGAILVVTGPTVIMPLIRQTKLAPRVSSLMKWEGILNDPFGALLAVVVFEYFIASGSWSPSVEVAVSIAGALLVATALGAGGGFLLKYAFQNNHVPEFLKVPLILCMIILIYGAANQVQEEAGLLAVTIFGFLVGNIGLGIIHELRRFKEYITIFLVSTVFIILTSSLKPGHLAGLDWRSFAFLSAVLFVVRPLSVWLATIGGNLEWKERLLLGWIAPRGVVAASVAGLFAPKLIEGGFPDASYLVPLVFSVIFVTVVLHGLSLNIVAKWLGLAAKTQEGFVIVGASPWTTEFADMLKNNNIPVVLVDNSWHRLREARLRNIPTFDGEILSEASEESLDLTEMGYLFAATDNDAYNALVCNSYGSDEFGRENVFQLSMHIRGRENSDSVKSANRGRIAFAEGLRYEHLLERYFQGWRFYEMTIEDDFDLETFMNEYEGNVEPLFLITKGKKVIVDRASKPVKPETGDQLFSFVSSDFSIKKSIQEEAKEPS